MATYLLLRDNKESGPHTANDLVKLGLKAYDLVWVEGKSAAWRYPSEIEELKPYAPVAEEQPFDRFFKKNTEEKKETPPATKEQSQYAPVAKEEIKFTPKRSVFVTLPGQKIVKAEQPAPAPKPVKQTPPPPAVIDDIAEEAQIKYSQPLDEIKEMYVKTLKQRKSKIARKSFLMANLKRAAVIAGLICVGVLTGFIIKSKPGNKKNITLQTIPASLPAVTNSLSNEVIQDPVHQDRLQAIDQPTDEFQDKKAGVKADFDEPLKTEQPQPTVRIRKETMIKHKEKKEFDDNQVSPGVETDPLTGERNKKVRGGSETEERPALKIKKNSLNELVSVSSNDYKRVAFGGIRNLQLTITNNSNYTLDNVIVELQYLKPSEEPLRTENIRFHSVAPNGTSTIRVPDTNRGIMVVYKIISIESKQSGDDVAGR
jgi:hypothetical protein